MPYPLHTTLTWYQLSAEHGSLNWSCGTCVPSFGALNRPGFGGGSNS